MIDILKVPSPCFVMEEDLLRKNLALIKSVSDRTGVEIILAFKAFAMWKSFPIFREYIDHSTASSVAEAQLAFEEEKKELFAKSKGFSYVNLGGEIGCMVNGAGLAMATMDIIKLYGGNPANFLDIGGSSSPTKVIEAMRLLLNDKNVKVVLINIFGGITRCDDVAKGLLEAFRQIKTDIPVVIRLTGTNEKEGRAMLKYTDLHVAKTMSKATRIAVELAQQHQY
jgi:succinyl-CoA synthetase beta subunit